MRDAVARALYLSMLREAFGMPPKTTEQKRWDALEKWVISVDEELEAIQETLDEMLGRVKKHKRAS